MAHDLSPGEWVVLALIAERPTHGFAVARLTRPDSEVGRIWAMRRPLVYRTITVLTEQGLVAPVATEDSAAGPPRTLLRATSKGRARLRRWLDRPVTRIREARSELMLKLLFNERAGRDDAQLLAAQRDVFAQRVGMLGDEMDRAEGFDRTLLLWRLETTAAGLRVCEALLAGDA